MTTNAEASKAKCVLSARNGKAEALGCSIPHGKIGVDGNAKNKTNMKRLIILLAAAGMDISMMAENEMSILDN